VDIAQRAFLITGGSRGIGLATARRLLSDGASVIITGLDPERLDAARIALGGHSRIRAVVADAASVEDCKLAVEVSLEAFERLDGLFTNAGSYEATPLEQMTEEIWDTTLDTHLKGTFFAVQAAAGPLRITQGAVVTMASDAGILGYKGGWAAYCAAKGGIISLTRQLALDLAPDVRVNAIAPGPVATDHLRADLARLAGPDPAPRTDPADALTAALPLKRMITPDEVADAVVFVFKAGAMTGSVLSLDAGSTAGLLQ
jgi:NAD(P)-dependent dehydrogenase (short-subunit alcohol dehydrogenase family)